MKLIEDLLDIFLSNGFTAAELLDDVRANSSDFRQDMLTLAEDMGWLDTELINALAAVTDGQLISLLGELK